MARHTGFRGRTPARTRRNTDWGFGPDILETQLSATGKALGTTSLVVTEQQTIVRIRGLIHVTLITAAAASDGFVGAAGVALVNSDAFGVGITAIPGPLTDAHWDRWMWHSFWDVRAITATIADGVNAASVSQRITIDSKSMRKWDVAETLVLMVEGIESGTSVVEFNGEMRMLLKAA